MERFAFIHGSSVGQSTFIPSGSPESICNDIANKYFQGRILRQKESAVKISLFVEFYKSLKGESYMAYSFVNNNCRGANGREGQYLALTIICKNVYVYPESIFRMLSAAYSQMLATRKIIGINKDGEEQYVISQFSDASEYLSVFLKKIEGVFDNITNGLGLPLDVDSLNIADYDSWHGTKVNMDFCNSMAAFNSFCEMGRLYISEEYESSNEKIKTLEEHIDKLEKEKLNSERLRSESKNFERSKANDEIEGLNSQIKEKDRRISALTSENENYKATIETVRGELEKYAKLGKSITNMQGKKSQYQSKSKTDILKICLLMIILILTIVIGLMNYAFFRNLPLSLEQDEEKSGITGGIITADEISENENQAIDFVSTDKLQFKAEGGESSIEITTDGEWSTPTSPYDWVRITKDNDKQLLIIVKPNANEETRNCTFTIKTGNLEKQISITQEGIGAPQSPVNYGVIITDSAGNKLASGTTVYSGQTLTATVNNPCMSNGFGWKYDNCTGNNNDQNWRIVYVTITGNSGTTAYIGYGNLSDRSQRQRFSFKIQSVSQATDGTDGDASETAASQVTNDTGVVTGN